MIIYIFNNYFPDYSGFGKRCKKEIEILSKIDEIVVLCKKRNMESNIDFFKTQYNKVKIIRFEAKSTVMERTNEAYKSGFYELKRNFDLLSGISATLFKILWNNKKNTRLKLYVIVSPLTVPLIVLILAKIYNKSPEIVEFHDLEPELAIHIKGLSKKNIVVKIEYLLEKIISRSFNKIIVTNDSQAEIIAKRTGADRNNIHVIPNSIQVEETQHIKQNLKTKYKISKNDFVIGYISNFSYDYTIDGLISLLKLFPNQKENLYSVKFMLIGDGDGLLILKKKIYDMKLEDNFIFVGRVTNVSDYINIFDIGLIPWLKNDLTISILPTKLFEYMHAKKPILVPNFGEFKQILTNGKEALLYNSTAEFFNYIIQLKSNENLRLRLSRNTYERYFRYYNQEIYRKKIKDIFKK